jgi:hypothetical protein
MPVLLCDTLHFILVTQRDDTPPWMRPPSGDAPLFGAHVTRFPSSLGLDHVGGIIRVGDLFGAPSTARATATDDAALLRQRSITRHVLATRHPESLS